ncbi:MAG: DUF6883 domain-containing protein [Candidatus Omnitrophota bacterium]
MKVPNCENALIHPKKITEYLLSFKHRRGKGKAKFFYLIGFTLQEWEKLDQALRKHVTDNLVVKVENTPYGFRYVVEGRFLNPMNKNVLIRTVWFIEQGKDIPRFVTAYPLERSKL